MADNSNIIRRVNETERDAADELAARRARARAIAAQTNEPGPDYNPAESAPLMPEEEGPKSPEEEQQPEEEPEEGESRAGQQAPGAAPEAAPSEGEAANQPAAGATGQLSGPGQALAAVRMSAAKQQKLNQENPPEQNPAEDAKYKAAADAIKKAASANPYTKAVLIAFSIIALLTGPDIATFLLVWFIVSVIINVTPIGWLINIILPFVGGIVVVFVDFGPALVLYSFVGQKIKPLVENLKFKPSDLASKAGAAVKK